MAFAMPLAARSRAPRAHALLFRLVPALLLGAGALLLAKPWSEALPAVSAAPSVVPAGARPALEPSALLGALLVVGGLLFFLPAILQRLGPAVRGRGRIAVVESRPLGGRRSLLLVEVDGRRLLIGASEGGLATLAELDDRSGAGTGRFARTLDQALGAPAELRAAPAAPCEPRAALEEAAG